MAVIDPSGLFNGERLARCSIAAQLHWPRLLLASDGFGRLEINYARIVGKAYPRFNPIPSDTEIQHYIQEYVNNYLLFPYEVAGQLWGQWDIRRDLLPRYKTAIDRRSPIPPEPAFTQWKQRYREDRNGFPKSFGNISVSFLRGVGVGEGIGENLSCPSRDGQETNQLSDLDRLHFDELEATPPKKKTPPKKTTEPWLRDEDFMAFFCREFWPAYPRRDQRKRAAKVLWKVYQQRELDFLREKILTAVQQQMRPGGRLNPTGGPQYIPMATTWLNGEEWENQEPGESQPPEGRLMA